MIRIVNVLQRDAVELALVDVRDAIVFASLRWTDRTFHVVPEALRWESGIKKNNQLSIEKKLTNIRLIKTNIR